MTVIYFLIKGEQVRTVRVISESIAHVSLQNKANPCSHTN